MKFLFAALLFFFAVSSAQSAHAAGVDCATSKSDFDKIVCANPKLLALNDDVEKFYQAALAEMPEDGKYDIEVSQDEWRKKAVMMCTPAVGKRDDVVANDCEGVFRGRTYDLKEPLNFSLGGVNFRRVYHYSASRSAWEYRNAAAAKQSYVQIVNPADESQRLINTYLLNLYRADTSRDPLGAVDHSTDPSYTVDRSDEDYSYRQSVESVGSGLISFYDGYSVYTHGTPHGFGREGVSTWNVEKTRPLDFFDVFKADVDAKTRLKTKIYTHYYDVGSGEDLGSPERPIWIKNAVENDVFLKWKNTDGWSVLAEGLILTFHHGDFYSDKGSYDPCYYFSWKELEGIVDVDSVKRLTAGPVAYGPDAHVLRSECHPDYKPKK